MLLDKIFEEEMNYCSKILSIQNICMSLDSWIITVNEPVICVIVSASPGEVYLIESIDTSGHSYN